MTVVYVYSNSFIEQVAIAILHRETEHIPPALNNTATYSSSNIARGSQMSVDHPTVSKFLDL